MLKLFKNVKLITPFEVLHNHCLIIKNGRIKNIIKDKNIDLGSFKSIVDGEGMFLAPGFIDIHNHGNSGYDIMDSTEESLDEIGRYHISNGVTSYLGTIITSSYKNINSAVENIVNYKNKKDRSQIIGIYLEGPFFNMIEKGAQAKKHIDTPNIGKIKSILNISQEMLKVVSLAPELIGSVDIIKYLINKDIVVSMGHSNSGYDEAKLGIENGISLATHLYNGMRSFKHREPGIIGASLTDERVYCELIYDRFHLHDIAAKIALKMKGFEKIVLVSDAMRAAGLEDGEYELGGQKVLVKDNKARLQSGVIAGSTLNLQSAVLNMIKYLQVPINEAVKMAG